MLSKIMRMLAKRSPEFVIIFMFQTAIYFIWEAWFIFNAACISILCFLYVPLVMFVVPTLPRWYRSKIGDLPSFDAVQAVLCCFYAASAWLPILWKVG